GRSLFKQRRQDIEKLVIRMSQRHDVVTAAVFLVARRMSDTHGESSIQDAFILSGFSNLD
ncbi:MAG: hypothetical protein ACXU84_14360, partial [Xanthobacteraceae bacterium]